MTEDRIALHNLMGKSAGAIDLRIPKLRRGSCFPAFQRPPRTAEKALIAVIQEAYVQGIFTRNVDDLVKAMGMTGITKSQLSRLCEEIGERVHAFLNRPLEGDRPFVWLDATYVKVRQDGCIVSLAAILAIGVDTAAIKGSVRPGSTTDPSQRGSTPGRFRRSWWG